MSQIIVKDLNDQIEKIVILRSEEALAGQAKKLISDKLEEAELRMIEMLTECEMTSHESALGKVFISHRTSVKTPKTEEERLAFFGYLKERGMYDSMISVNSQTLNSFYKSELERAKEEGRDDFAIPGIDGVTITQTLSVRK